MSKKVVESPLMFAALVAMAPAEIYKLAAGHVKISDSVSTAQDKYTNSLKPFAKVVAAVKRLWVEMREKRTLALDIAFNKFFKDNVKGDLPGRAEALAALFNSLVLTFDANKKPLLAEENFDAAAVDWLEKANAIVKLAQKKYGDPGWQTSDEVLDVINALSKPGDARKTLQDIRKRMKGETPAAGEAGEGGETAEGETAEGANATSVKMTPALAAQFLCAAFKGVKELPEDKQIELCALLYDLNDAWANCGLDIDTLERFDKQIQQNRKNGVADGIKVITGENAEAPKALAA